MSRYLIVIEKAPNNYSAYSPDVPGCVTTGKTIDETVASMKEALEFHLGEDPLPEAKGLRWYIDNSDIEDSLSQEGNLIASLEIF